MKFTLELEPYDEPKWVMEGDSDTGLFSSNKLRKLRELAYLMSFVVFNEETRNEQH